MNTYVHIGKPEKRIDALEKVTGEAIYGDDLKFSNLLYGKVLRSKYAHAKILNINIDKAKNLPGVKGVVIGKDIPVLGGEAIKDCPFLAIEKVRYVGEPIAAVAATSEEIAEEALDLIEVEYEELPVLLDPLKAIQQDAPLIHEKINSYIHIPIVKPVKNSNICHNMQIINGDTDKGFRKSDFIFEDTFTTQMQQHGAIEPHVAIAQVHPAGKITVWVTNDSPHRLRKDLTSALGIPLSKLRVIIPPFLGGGFGGKGGLKVETICIALALKTGYKPVKILLTREEVFTSSLVRHPSIVKIKTGVKKDGRLWAREVKLIFDTGAYAEKGPTVVKKATVAAIGPYKIPNIKIDSYCVYTNKAIAGAYRGYGVPQVAWAHESQMDIIANQLGIDPVELRLKNIVEEGDKSPTDQHILHSVGLKECIEKVAENVENNKFDRKNRGKGIACGFENTKTPAGSSAIVKMSPDGSVEVLTSTVEVGQGSKTIFSQIVSEEFGIPLESVTISINGDTDVTPFDACTTASRSTFHMGNAMIKAAVDVKKQLFKIASTILGSEIKDLQMEKGGIFAKENPDKRLSFAEIIKSEYRAGLDIIGVGSYYPIVAKDNKEMWSAPSVFTMYGAQMAEVEIDTETGIVKVLKVVAATDAGKAINPVTCEGQIEGGVTMGISSALFEEMIIGEKGEILNPSFLDYKIPSALDVPDIIPIIVESNQKDGPYGAKGIGEVVVIPTAAAIANAIYDAVGIRIKDLPITADKILKLLKVKLDI